MLAVEAPKGARTLMLYFRRGELVLEELKKFIEKEGINTALVVGGLGSFDICHLHTISHTEMPPKDYFFTLEGPLEVGSLQGTIAGGEPHIHVVLHDTAKDKVYVGHLEPGSRCCYVMEMGLIILDGVRTERRTDPETNLRGIFPAE